MFTGLLPSEHCANGDNTALAERHTTLAELLRDAGLDITFPQNREFARGLCGFKESMEELSAADALLAGSEYVTAEMLSALPNHHLLQGRRRLRFR